MSLNLTSRDLIPNARSEWVLDHVILWGLSPGDAKIRPLLASGGKCPNLDAEIIQYLKFQDAVLSEAKKKQVFEGCSSAPSAAQTNVRAVNLGRNVPK
ncbi:hypothetical protein MW887_007627 [Aspergillus wentii]|nr:hypothetical protein MW887_007627 [Aspergillus wentii]